jgi:uncharacterized protein YndB with AHSA1/START domain
MLKIIGITVVVAVVGILAAAAMRPDSFAVSRSITINAPAGRVYPQIVDFHSWAGWSPWEKLDPAMKRSFSGSESGKGAVYAWDGNSKVGSGRMEITDAVAPGHVTVALRFIKPMEASNVAEFTLDPRGETTQVTWTMHGPSPFITKLFGVFVSMDKMVGGMFESGLASLKAVAEQPAAKPA